MYLAILIAILGAVAIIFLGVRYSEDWIGAIVPLVVLCVIIAAQSLNSVSEDEGKFTVHINNETVFCRDYQTDGNIVTIPTHYILKFSWINYYEYCTEPLVIDVPDGVILDIHQTFPPKARIVSGGIDCVNKINGE